MAALESGDIDEALMFTTQGISFDRGWVLLSDDRGLQPAENVVPAIREEVLDDEMAELLDAISAVLTTEELTELNRRVDVDGDEPGDLAREWPQDKGLFDS